jgi:hypothetical protein
MTPHGSTARTTTPSQVLSPSLPRSRLGVAVPRQQVPLPLPPNEEYPVASEPIPYPTRPPLQLHDPDLCGRVESLASLADVSAEDQLETIVEEFFDGFRRSVRGDR